MIEVRTCEICKKELTNSAFIGDFIICRDDVVRYIISTIVITRKLNGSRKITPRCYEEYYEIKEVMERFMPIVSEMMRRQEYNKLQKIIEEKHA